jgi:hypothetical protein
MNQMAVRDIDIVAELLARIGGSWHPERPRPAPNGISSRHRDVARLILAELRRRDAARTEALSQLPEPTGQDVTPETTGEAEIPVGTVVAYCPPGDTRTITCTVEKIERGHAYLVPVRREIGWISTNTLQSLPSQVGRPKPSAWPMAGQAVPYRDGGAPVQPNAAVAPGGAERPLSTQAASIAAPPSPGREPAGTAIQARLPQKTPTPRAALSGKRPRKAGASSQASPAKAPDAPSKAAESGKAAIKVQHFFDSSGQWVAFRHHDNDRYLYNTKGKWIGWFPWKDGEVVDIHGRYLGMVLDKDRIYRKTSAPTSGRKAGFVSPPGDSGYAGYAERVAFCDPPYGYQDIDWRSLAVGERGRLKNTRHTPPPAEAGYLQRFLSMIGLSALSSRIERTMRPTDAR